MKFLTQCKFFSLILVIALVAPVTGETRLISLSDCVRTALENHPDMQLSKEDKKKALADYKVVKSERNIKVAGSMKSVEYLKEDSSANSAFNVPGVDTDLGLFLGITTSYTLYSAKKKDAELAARENIHLAKISTQEKTEQIALNVKKAYYDYIISQKSVLLWAQLLENAEKKKRQAEILFENGLRPVLDVTSATVSLRETQLEYGKALSSERRSRNLLFESMGLVSDPSIQISGKDFDKTPVLRASIDRLYRLASLNNTSIRSVRVQKKVCKYKLDMERSSRFPKVDFLFSLGYVNRYFFNSDSNSNFGERFSGGNWSPQFNAGIQAEIPIYYGGLISARVDSAISEYNQTVYQERSTILKVNNLIQNHYNAINELKKQFTIAELIIENAEKHLLLAQRSYENGEGTQFELQNAAQSVIKAQLSYLNVRKEYHMTLANLAKIVGVDEEEICR